MTDSLWQNALSYSEHLVVKTRIEIHSALKMIVDYMCLCVCSYMYRCLDA
jgi:hypothetical protein